MDIIPWSAHRMPSTFASVPEYFDFKNLKLPAAERACGYEAAWLDENIFRIGRKGAGDAAAAIRKIQVNALDLNEAAREFRKKYGRQARPTPVSDEPLNAILLSTTPIYTGNLIAIELPVR